MAEKSSLFRHDIKIPVFQYPKCTFCGELIKNRTQIIRHKNSGTNRDFCSKKCRDKWCYAQQAK